MDIHKYNDNDMLFRQKFDDYEVELPSDDWEVFSQKLAAAQPKRRRFVWYYVAAAASVIGILFLGVTYLNHNDSVEDLKFAEHKSCQPNSQPASHTLAKATSLQPTKRINAYQKLSAVKADANSKKESTESETTTYTIPYQTIEKTNEVSEKKSEQPTVQSGIASNSASVSNFDTTGYITHPVKQYAELPAPTTKDASKDEKRGKQDTSGSNNLVKWLAGTFQGNLGLNSNAGNSLMSDGTIGSHLFSRVSQANALQASTTPTLMSFSDKKTYYVPMSFGLSAGFPLSERWEIQSGLIYTLLITTGELQASSNIKATGRIEQHYLGIPVTLAYAIIHKPNFSVYLTGGGRIEKGISLVEKIYTYNAQNEPTEQERYHYSINGVQLSLDAGIGASYRLYRFINWYIEVGGAWYIPSNQPESSRTEHPLNASLKTGLRFSLSK